MNRPNLIHLNPIQFYLFMTSLNKCKGICNADDDLSTKICVPSEIKNVDVKLFHIVI